MTYSFNLIDQPWIPCITTDGQFVEVGLYGLLTEGQHFKEICAETPLLTAAIYPVALAVLHRVFGPAKMADWVRLWERDELPVEPLNAYFERWYARFDLFDAERPFYQMDDARVEEKSVIHLVHSIGNSATLFSHANDSSPAVLTPAQAAQYLLTSQCFRTAGLSGLKGDGFTDGILTRGVIFWAQGRTVLQTLLLNLIRYPDETWRIPTSGDDRPIWEADDPFHQRTLPIGYLDYLTWPSNRVWLLPEMDQFGTVVRRMKIAPGLRVSEEVHSPQKRYIKKEKKGEVSWSFLYFNTDKALWRDYHTVFAQGNADYKPPAVIQWLAEVNNYIDLAQDHRLRLTAIGMLADQAKPIFYRHEMMPLPLELLRDADQWALTQQAVEHAEAVEDGLYEALSKLADLVLMRGGTQPPDGADRKKLIQQWQAQPDYWVLVEPRFWEFIDGLGSAETPTRWQAALQEIARDVLARTIRMAGDTPWAIRGGVIAERILTSELKKIFK